MWSWDWRIDENTGYRQSGMFPINNRFCIYNLPGLLSARSYSSPWQHKHADLITGFTMPGLHITSLKSWKCFNTFTCNDRLHYWVACIKHARKKIRKSETRPRLTFKSLEKWRTNESAAHLLNLANVVCGTGCSSHTPDTWFVLF